MRGRSPALRSVQADGPRAVRSPWIAWRATGHTLDKTLKRPMQGRYGAAGTRAYRLCSNDLLPALLVCPHQLCFRQQVAGEGALELLSRGLLQIVEHRIQRSEDEEVAVTSDGRTWAAVAGPLPVVEPRQRPARQPRLGDAPRQSFAV